MSEASSSSLEGKRGLLWTEGVSSTISFIL
jgi:hypothetical protein